MSKYSDNPTAEDDEETKKIWESHKKVQAAKIESIMADQNPHLTGRVSVLGDEVAAWKGFSDAGEEGWFAGVFYRYAGYPYMPMLSTNVFFSGKNAEKFALHVAAIGSFEGFADVISE